MTEREIIEREFDDVNSIAINENAFKNARVDNLDFSNNANNKNN